MKSQSAAELYRKGQRDMRRLLGTGGIATLDLPRARRARADDLGQDDQDDQDDIDRDDDDDDDDDDGSDEETLVASFAIGHYSRRAKSGGLNVFRRAKR